MEVRRDTPRGDEKDGGRNAPAADLDVNGASNDLLGERADEELSRRERERLMRRQLMLNAARSVFAEKGYSAATLDEIAQRAEFGKGTLYNYFEGGKEEILWAVFDDLYDDLEKVIGRTFNPALVDEKPFREVFDGFLAAIFAFFNERQDQFMIMMKEGHRLTFNDEPEKAEYFMNQGERIVHALIEPIEAANKKGVLRNFPPRSVAHMIMGNVKGYHMHMCMAGCRETAADFVMPSSEEAAAFLTTFLLDGLLSDENQTHEQ